MQGPLSPAALHILLALAPGELHGYGIMQEIARQSNGAYKLGPGTLYDNLQRLLDAGWVEEVPQKRGSDDDPRRRNYRLRTLGRNVLATEIERLDSVVRQARQFLPVPKPERA